MHSLPNSIWPAQVVAGGDGSVWALDIHGNLYQYAAAQSAWQQLLGTPAGLLDVAVVDATNLWGITRDANNSGAFILYQYVDGAWEQVAGVPVMSQINVIPQVSAGADGTVWLLDGNGIPRVIGWAPAASSWSAQRTSLSLESIAAAGPEAAWAVGADGTFWRNFGSGWVAAQAPLPAGAAATQVSLGNDGTVWSLDDTGRLYVKRAVTTPAAPALNVLVPPVSRRDTFGALWLFCVDAEGVLWTSRQAFLEYWWGELMSLGGPAEVGLKSLAVGQDQEGRLQVFAIGAGALWYNRQTAPHNGWGGWASLEAPPSVTLDSLTVGANAGGRLQVFAIDTQNSLHTIWETAANAWSDWGCSPRRRLVYPSLVWR
jgi:Tectonin domain